MTTLTDSIAWYDSHAVELARSYEAIDPKRLHSWFIDLLPPAPALVLDVGAGMGRDAAWLAGKGYSVVAVEPSAAMRAEAEARYAGAKVVWVPDQLPTLAKIYRQGLAFNAILLSGVWQHVPPSEREYATCKLLGLLRAGGILALSLRHGPSGAGRSMHPVSLEVSSNPPIYEQYRELLDAFWATALELGRLPEAAEFTRAGELLSVVGSMRKAFTALPFPGKEAELACAAERRTDDLLVYLALNIFERRGSFGSTPTSVQRDIKSFLGSHKAALERARRALFAAGDPGLIATAVAAAAVRKVGVLDASDGDYMFHTSLLDQQPAPLRIMLGCAERLEHLPPDADLVKVHGSGDRVSYLGFDGFAERGLPALARRTVVDLRKRRVSDVSVDTRDGRRVLLGKASFMPSGMPGRERQERFDEGLRQKGVLECPGLGPGLRTLTRRLAEAGLVPQSAAVDVALPQNNPAKARC